eukprot:199400_1
MLQLSLLLIHAAITIHQGDSETFIIQVGQKGPLLNTDFVSNTMGFRIVKNWPSQFFESIQVNTLAKGLYGSFIRFGGTPQDQPFTIQKDIFQTKHYQNCSIHNDILMIVGMQQILLHDQLVYAFELGNEPDGYNETK